MSGFFLGLSDRDGLDEVCRKLCFAPDAVVDSVTCGKLLAVVSRVDSLSLWGPAKDPVSGVSVLLAGRIAFDETEWKKAEALTYQGGLACRLLLARWLRD